MHNGGNCVVVHYDVNWPILYKHLPIQITLHLLVMEWVPNLWFSGTRNQPHHYKTFKKHPICMAIIWKKLKQFLVHFPFHLFSSDRFCHYNLLASQGHDCGKICQVNAQNGCHFFFKFQRKYFNLWNRMHFIIKTISVGYYLKILCLTLTVFISKNIGFGRYIPLTWFEDRILLCIWL